MTLLCARLKVADRRTTNQLQRRVVGYALTKVFSNLEKRKLQLRLSSAKVNYIQHVRFRSFLIVK